jgi:TIR domain
MSYRRADSVGTAGRLFDRLAERFGVERVFRDIDSIEAGEDFDDSIRDALRLATVVLIVIGPRWLDARSADGTRRIDDPGDYVRREIEIGLSSDATVIPLLVEGATLPAPASLPESIRALARHNDWELSNRRWDSDIRDFFQHLEQRLGVPAREPTGTSTGGDGPTGARSLAQVGLRAVAGFLPNLLSLLAQPRRFLARYTRGRASDLLAAVIFLLLILLLCDLVLMTVYRPRESVISFYVSGVLLASLVVGVISFPLWLAWRLVGARRHGNRLLVVLLHQVAIAHLVLFVAGTIVLAGLELRSRNSASQQMLAAVEQESASEALRLFGERLQPLFQGPEVFFATALSVLVALAGGIWAIRSWGTYRDAFDLSRRRSVGALLVFVLGGWAAVALLGWLAVPAR